MLVRRLVRHRWPILAGWLVVLAVAGLGALGLGDRLSGGGWYAPGAQSSRAIAATEEGFVGRGRTTVTLVTRDDRFTDADPGFARRAAEAFDHVSALPGLRVAGSYGWATSDGQLRTAFVGAGGRTTVTTLGLDLADGDARRELPELQDALDDRYGERALHVSLVGPAPLWGEINVLSERGLLRAELLALPFLLVVMLWVYRGWVAAALSLLVAMTSVLWTLGILSVVARHVELSLFVQNPATMLGLGVAVDYSLFVISRYREQLTAGEDVEQALASALRTAGHTVLSSGVTVVLAMGTLFLVDLPVIRSLAFGAVLVVSVAMVVNLVVLPTLLAVAGRRVAGHQEGQHVRTVIARRWLAWTGRVMRFPVVSLVAGLGVLAFLALPAGQLSTFTPDARIVPQEATVRVGWDAVRADFGPGAASPISVVVLLDSELSGHPAAADVLALPERLDQLTGTARVVSAGTLVGAAGFADPLQALSPAGRATLPPALAGAVGHHLSADGRTVVVDVVPDDTGSSGRARTLLAEIRAEVAGPGGGLDVPGVEVVVGGETAEGVDGNAAIAEALPLVAATMLVVIYLVLMLTFRSVFLPLKAIALNVASVAATYGVLVVVFQEGWGATVLGFEATGQVTNFVPVLLLALLFSLSTDYEVFLLSRVREEWEGGASNTEAVARGVALTAPLISGAAVVMVVVFSAFALASVLPVQELGLGMAVAIVIDATLVRLVLVPASMQLMGRWNWWNPWSSTTPTGARGTRAPTSTAPVAGEGRDHAHAYSD